jgi:hypothetical protein
MCELLTGNTKNVCEEAGGVTEWYASSFKNVAGYTENNGEITAIAMESGKTFFPIKVDPTTSTYTDAATGDFASGKGFTPSATIITKGYAKEDYTFQNQLEGTRIVLIAKRSNGTYVMLFRDFGGKALTTLDAGTGFETFNGATITVTGFETKKAIIVQPSVVAGVLAGGE